jgi:hypothetical protein
MKNLDHDLQEAVTMTSRSTLPLNMWLVLTYTASQLTSLCSIARSYLAKQRRAPKLAG